MLAQATQSQYHLIQSTGKFFSYLWGEKELFSKNNQIKQKQKRGDVFNHIAATYQV